MLTLIVLVALVLWAGNTWGEGAGVVALFSLLVFLGILMWSSVRRDVRAYQNWIEYWQRRRD